MKRSIIRIDEDKCNGCGQCVPSCHEGAIRLVNGKARLAADNLCDGLGACLGECPRGAITIEEREAEAYDEIEALENIMKEGPEAVAAHLQHLKDHGQDDYVKQAEDHLNRKKEPSITAPASNKPMACGCPGSMTRDFRQGAPAASAGAAASGPMASELRQWPVQLRLLNPRAPFFQDADLVVSADCVAFTHGDFHRKFLKGKTLLIFCPKLDEDLEAYVDRLTEIFKLNNIKSVTVLRMEVPCCGGTVAMTEEALLRSGKNIIMKEYTIGLQGEVLPDTR